MAIIRFNGKFSKGYDEDAGLDLYLAEGAEIKAGATVTLKSQLRVLTPEGVCALVLPRSSSSKRGLLVHTGVIDPWYIGDINIICTNLTNKTIKLKKDARIAQLVLLEMVGGHMVHVDEFEDRHGRKDKGLGSTGE